MVSRPCSILAWTTVLLAFALPAAAGPFTPGADAQRRAAEGLAPADLMLPAPAQRPTTTAVVRVRFYADDDYRAGLFRWADRTKMQLQLVNKVLEGAFGVRFEPESFRRWHRTSGNIDIYQMLAELEKMDPGEGVDWVVAYVSPLPLISTSIHEIGAARLLGKHFLMRGMASADEAAMFGKNFDQLDRAERENLYSIRKFHKETTIFLHEWLHTLGGMHSNDRQRINHASYSNKMSNLSVVDAELAAAALHDRLTTKQGAPVDWSGLRTALERASSPEWSPKEREELINLLKSSGAQIVRGGGQGTVRNGDLAGEDGEKLNEAIALMKAGKAKEAWAIVKPLGAKHPKNAEVQRMVCRLGFVPSSKDEGSAACARAKELDPKGPEPLIDAAQALILRKETKDAMAAADEAAERARKLPKAPDEVWCWIAQIYGQIGALSKAEEALARVPESATAAQKTRALVQGDRRRLGLPPGQRSTEVELEYADRFRKMTSLIESGKAREARAAVEAARRDYPDVPGVEVLSCELDLRQGRIKQGEKACTHALSVMDDLPRAHYLLGHVRLQTGARDAAAESLRRAIELDPNESAPYLSLAELYRYSGKKQQLASLKAEYEKIFSKPLR
jgi:predicted Zn-dependent protease